MDTLVLTSVWAIQVIRWMCQGVGAVGISATNGVTASDAQRLKMIASGLGPAIHPAAPLPDINPAPAAHVPVPVPASAPAPAAAAEEETKMEEVNGDDAGGSKEGDAMEVDGQ